MPNNSHIKTAQTLLIKHKDLLVGGTAVDAQVAAKELDQAAGIKEGSALATVAGETKEARDARIEQAKVQAVDLTSMVRKKKPAASTESTNGNGASKRKLEDDDNVSEKKVRFD
jgi:hypothetical protein